MSFGLLIWLSAVVTVGLFAVLPTFLIIYGFGLPRFSTGVLLACYLAFAALFALPVDYLIFRSFGLLVKR